MELKPINSKRKTGREPFVYNGKKHIVTLLDFWKWSGSDVTTNTTRGILAEFIVAMALRQHKGIRMPWNAFDLLSKEGIKIEVKSAAYIQSWHQQNFSKIAFSIRPARAWSSETNQLADEQKRQAEIYVFALLKYLDKLTINPLDLNQWTFFVISTKRLEKTFPKAKSISLKKLQNKLQPTECSYKRLRKYIIREAAAC
ncbi:MAG: hypothetical protein WCE45_06560 [Sedimentisphaerales bacterium]